MNSETPGSAIHVPGARLLASPRAVAGLIVALAALSYVSALDAGFVWDDRPLVLEDARVRGAAPWSTILTRPYGSSVALDPLWRPAVVFSYALDHACWGAAPAGFHATSLLLHVAACLAVWLALRALAPTGPAAALAALLFAVHPVHAEAVTWIAGRSDLLGGLFAALAVWAFLRAGEAEGKARAAWLAGSCAAYLLGLGSKEVVAPLPLFLAGAEWVRARAGGRRPAWKMLIPLGAVLAVWLGLRWAVLGRVGGLSLFDAWRLDGATRLRAAGAVLADHLRLVLWPARLCADYAVNRDPAAVARAAASGGAWVGLALAAAALPLSAGLARRRPAVALGLLWHALFLLPASNLVVGIGVIEAERLLYLPSAGLLLALVALAAGGGERWQRVAVPVLLVALLPLALRTFVRNLDWRDDERLYRSMVRDAPDNPYAHSMLGTVLTRAGRLDEASERFAAALAIKPDYGLAFAGRAEVKRQRGDLEGALDDLNRAQLHAPQTRTRVARALALLEGGQTDTARTELRAAVDEHPDDADAWNGLGAMHLLLRDDPRTALEAFEKAAALRPGDPLILSNRGLARLQTGDRAGALRDQEEAIRLDPRSADAHKRRGVALYGPDGDLAEAERSLREAVRLAPQDAEAANYLVLVLCARADRVGVADLLTGMQARGVPLRAEVAAEVERMGR